MPHDAGLSNTTLASGSPGPLLSASIAGLGRQYLAQVSVHAVRRTRLPGTPKLVFLLIGLDVKKLATPAHTIYFQPSKLFSFVMCLSRERWEDGRTAHAATTQGF